MADKDKHAEPAATELDDKELNEAQGGLSLSGKEERHKQGAHLRSRGNNVFGFEDLPNN